MLKTAVVALAAIFLLAPYGLAQEHSLEVAASAGTILTKTVEGNGTTVSATQPLNLLGTFRFRIAPRFGLEANYGRAKNSQNYNSPPNTFRIQTQITEFTGDLVYSPFRTERVTTFILGGGGVLFFSPYYTEIDGVPTTINTSRQGRVGILFGAGADYHFNSRLALRLQYRGLFYSPPDFNVHVSGLFTGAHGYMGEPSVGVVFSF
jgi:opacity protein-like surface antigen